MTDSQLNQSEDYFIEPRYPTSTMIPEPQPQSSLFNLDPYAKETVENQVIATLQNVHNEKAIDYEKEIERYIMNPRQPIVIIQEAQPYFQNLLDPSDEQTNESEVHRTNQSAHNGAGIDDETQERLENGTVRNRNGRKRQSNAQRIWKMVVHAHICKNTPAQIYRRIKNYLTTTQRAELLDPMKKRFKFEDLVDFIQFSGLTPEQWDQILNLPAIYNQIDRSKKLATSKHFKNIPQLRKEFLIDLNKKIQKIIYRSVKRMITKILNGNEDVTYLDDDAQTELRQLDNDCGVNLKYSNQYWSLLAYLI